LLATLQKQEDDGALSHIHDVICSPFGSSYFSCLFDIQMLNELNHDVGPFKHEFEKSELQIHGWVQFLVITTLWHLMGIAFWFALPKNGSWS
jgi:hypothetical protein